MVHLVLGEGELALSLDQHLLFLDVAEELVTLALTLALEVAKVVFETVVSFLSGFFVGLVGMFSLLLHVGVDGVGALRVHHERVASVVLVRDVLAVNRLADNVVQLAVTVPIEGTVIGNTSLVEVKIGFLDSGHQSRRSVDDGGPVAVVNGLVLEVLKAGRSVLRLVNVSSSHCLPILGRFFLRLGHSAHELCHGDLFTVRASL